MTALEIVKDKTVEQIKVMQAYKAGSTIECTPKTVTYWTEINSPKWNWGELNYRVKQEPKLIPYSFEDAETLIGKAVKIKSNSEIMLITGVAKKFIFLASFGFYKFKDFLNECTWLDGSPCGKLID